LAITITEPRSIVRINRHYPKNSYYSFDNIDKIELSLTSKRREVNNMKKWVALIMALSLPLSVISVTLAQDPEQFKFRSGDRDRMRLENPNKKKATVKKKPSNKQPPPGLGPGDKMREEDAKKKGTFERMPENKQEQAPAEKK
jgi:hypothetical protein